MPPNQGPEGLYGFRRLRVQGTYFTTVEHIFDTCMSVF